MKRLAVLVVFLVLGMAVARALEPQLIAADPAGTDDGVISQDGRFILSSSRRGGLTTLWMYDIAARTWTQITHGPGEDSEPYWAPDSRRAVFVSKRDRSSDLWIVDVVSGNTVRLTHDETGAEYPAWSPDGRSIVYTGGAWGKRNFFTIPADGGTPTPVLPNAGNVGACSFGADSRHLMCHTYDKQWGDLIEIDLATRATKRLTDSDHWYYKPAESPDGQWLTFTDIGEDGDTIRLMPRLSSPTTALPAPQFAGRWPQFFNSGKHLFFHRQVDEGLELRLVDRSAHTIERIPVGRWTPGRASRSPDGRFVAYCATSWADGSSAVFMFDRTLKTGRQLTFDGEACEEYQIADQMQQLHADHHLPRGRRRREQIQTE